MAAAVPTMPPPPVHMEVGADWKPDGPRFVRTIKHSANASPPMPRMNFPPQPAMDSDPHDGPLSVAFHLRPNLSQIASKWPSPHTPQYLNRVEERVLHPSLRSTVAQPRADCDICGYVQAAIHDEDHAAANMAALEKMGIKHNSLRLVYAAISGWVLTFWRSKEEFQDGISGVRGAPHCFAWWDLRQAWDADVDFMDYTTEVCPHRIRVMTRRGNLYFRVEHPEDVPVWYEAIRRIIQDATLVDIRARDTELHQLKRWPAAKGIAECLLSNLPIGERALAIMFHCYDIDYDSSLQCGEIMILIQELMAAMLADEGRAEGQDRATAVASAATRIPEDELYDRAVRFRRRCAPAETGKIRKDDFIMKGHGAMLEALDLPPSQGLDALNPGPMANIHGEDLCTVM